ncbi:unnamed protein product [Phytomonas sp. EM1]|nr:unnamed protein product [Phytomonas sp. EM1]|eukprot:CCW61878.1 unnamed protein product [Phytomonas sp. isolate EM1]
MSLRMTSSSRSGNGASRERATNVDHRSTDDANAKNREYQGMTMLAETIEGQHWEQQPDAMPPMGATTFQSHIAEMAPTTGDYPATQPELPFGSMTSDCVAGVNSNNRRSAQQQQHQKQRASWLNPHSMNSTITQSMQDGGITAGGATNASCSRPSVAAAAQHRYLNFQNPAATNESMPSSAYSAFTPPVYGPSVATKYSQFVDITTNTGYMTPFELLERTTFLPGPASAPVDALGGRVSKEGGYTTSLDRIRTNGSLEEPPAVAISHNSIAGASTQSACCYPSSQQLLSALSSAPRVALSPQPSTQFRQTRQERSNPGSGVPRNNREEPVVVEEKDPRFSTQTEAPSTRSLSPHPAPKRRGAGAAIGETAPGLALDGTPLHQTTKLRAGSHQQHTNASMLSSFMGMTASTKAVSTPMARDAHGVHHSHPEGDDDDVKACLDSKLVTPQARGPHTLQDDNNASAGAAPTPTPVRTLLTESNINAGNPELTKKPATTSSTQIKGVMQKLLHHIQMKKTFEHDSATNPTYAPEAFPQGGEGASSFTLTNFTSTCSVSNLEIGNGNKPSDFATSFHTESSLASIMQLNRQGSQRGGSRQGKEGRQPPRQKHQREKKAAQPNAPPFASSLAQQEGTPTNETPDHETALPEGSDKCEDGKNTKGGAADANHNPVVSRSLQPSLMASIGTPALPRTTGVGGEPPLAPSRLSSPLPSELPPPASAFAGKSHSPRTPSQPSATAARKVYSVLLEGHMGQRSAALSVVPFERDVCVLFEGDRGVDMGCVVKCEEVDEKLSNAREFDLRVGNEKHKKKHVPPLVLRLATEEEQDDWLHTQVEEAQQAIQPCREAVENLGLPLTIVNAVYQFNREKLTFYYESDVRVDFRQLLQMMFARFYCRIWMERATPLPAAVAVGDGAGDDKRVTSCHS